MKRPSAEKSADLPILMHAYLCFCCLIQARNEKNKVFDRICEVNEERSVIKAEQHAMKFEETVSNIKRQQKAAEFRQAQLALEQQQKVERAQLLEVKKTEIAAERRYAAQQFLIEQERMREQLATSALNKSMEMANLSMGNVSKRCEASLEVTHRHIRSCRQKQRPRCAAEPTTLRTSQRVPAHFVGV
jgi:hypothetical protein